MKNTNKQQGFTLVELVLVIAIMGIASIGSTVFIVNTAKGLNDVTRRDSIANSLRSSVARISTQINNSISRSIRVKTRSNSQCVEMMPIQARGFYTQLPNTPSNHLKAIILSNAKTDAESKQSMIGMKAVLSGIKAPYFHEDLFNNTHASISSKITNQKNLEKNAADLSFKTKSFGNRKTRTTLDKSKAVHHQQLYFIDKPISYCIEDNNLYRYTDYTLRKSQSMPNTLPKKEPKRLLLSQNILEGSSFNYQAKTNSFLLALRAGNDDENLTVNQKLWLKND